MSDSRTDSELYKVSALLAEALRVSTEYERTATEVADALLLQANLIYEDALYNGQMYLSGKRSILGLVGELKVMLAIEYETRGI